MMIPIAGNKRRSLLNIKLIGKLIKLIKSQKLKQTIDLSAGSPMALYLLHEKMLECQSLIHCSNSPANGERHKKRRKNL